MENDEKLPMTYVSVPRKVAGEVVKRDIVEVSEELADRQIRRWEAHDKNPRSAKNPSGSLPGNPHWKQVRYATEEELEAAGLLKGETKKTAKEIAAEKKAEAAAKKAAADAAANGGAE